MTRDYRRPLGAEHRTAETTTVGDLIAYDFQVWRVIDGMRSPHVLHTG